MERQSIHKRKAKMFKQLLRSVGVLPSVFDRENVIIPSSRYQIHEIAVGIKDGKEGLRVGDSPMIPLTHLKKHSPDHLEYHFEKGAFLELKYERGRFTEYKIKVPSLDFKDQDVISLKNRETYYPIGAEELDKIFDMYERNNPYWTSW